MMKNKIGLFLWRAKLKCLFPDKPLAHQIHNVEVNGISEYGIKQGVHYNVGFRERVSLILDLLFGRELELTVTNAKANFHKFPKRRANHEKVKE